MKIAAPRLLPATIVALAALLGVKSVGLVRAIVPAVAAQAAVEAAAAPGTDGPGGEGPGQGTPPAAIGAPAAARAAAVPSPPAPAISPAEQALLLDLRRRRAGLDARARALAARESLLAAAERRLDQRVAELKALDARLQALQAAHRKRTDDAWSGLVTLYQSMKPRQAAAIFDKLSMPVLLAVVDRMEARRAAAILAAMQPDRARDVTDRLAALRLGRDGSAGAGSRRRRVMRGGWIACGLWLLLALPAAGAVAASPVAVRSGTHHGFGRLVFDFPTRVGWHMVRHGDVVRLRFDRRLPFGPDPSLPRNVRAFADAPGRAEVTVVPGARLRRLRVGARLVLDVLDPPRPRRGRRSGPWWCLVGIRR